MSEGSHMDTSQTRDTLASDISEIPSPQTHETPHSFNVCDNHHDFVSFLSLALKLEVDVMDARWQPVIPSLGRGGSSQINASNSVTKELTFAFKRTIPRSDVGPRNPTTLTKDRFKSLLREILISWQPEVSMHPNIASLMGISWEFHMGTVWPVLIYPKANFGNLRDLIDGPHGTNASLEIIIQICAEVALGLDVLHRNKIVHGDVNPRNILIHQKEARYVPIITDFEASCICDSEDDLVTLRKTIPWEAPEWHERHIPWKNAKKQDIYSYGLLCLYTIFQPCLNDKVVEIIPRLKSANEFSVTISNAIEKYFALSEHQNKSLLTFFQRTLCQSADERELDFEKLIRLLTFDEESEIAARKQETQIRPYPSPHSLSSIASNFALLTTCDYRVRNFLRDSLNSVILEALCSKCASQAALTLALGWEAGFFIPQDMDRIKELENQNLSSPAELKHEFDKILQDNDPPKRNPRALDEYRTPLDSDVTDNYRLDGILGHAEEHLRQEAQARTKALGSVHILTRDAQFQLFSILQAVHRLDEADKILNEIYLSCQRLKPHSRLPILAKKKAEIRAAQGRWAEAEKILDGEIRKTKQQFSEVRECIENLIQNNEELGKKYAGTKDMATVEMQRMQIEAMREESAEGNTIILELMDSMGVIYHGQGNYSLAVDTQRKVVEGLQERLGPAHPKTLSANHSLACSLWMQGEPLQALNICQEVLPRMNLLIGKDDPRSIECERFLIQIWSDMGVSSQYIPKLKDMIEGQKITMGPSSFETLRSESLLASLYKDGNDLRRALELQQDVAKRGELVFGPRHPFSIRSKKILGTLLVEIGDVTDGQDLILAAAKDCKDLFGEAHPEYISVNVAMVNAYQANKMFEEADCLGRKSLEALQNEYGCDHPITLGALTALIKSYTRQKKYEDAARLLQQAIEISTKTSGSQSSMTLRLLGEYSAITPNTQEAESIKVRIAEAKEKKLRTDEARIIFQNNLRGMGLAQTGKYEEGKDLLLSTSVIAKEKLGANHELTIDILSNLAHCYMGKCDWQNARDTIEDILKVRLGMKADNAIVLRHKTDLAYVLSGMGRLEEAIDLNNHILTQLEQADGDNELAILRAAYNQAAIYSRQSNRQNALKYLEKVVQIAEKRFGPDDSATIRYRAELRTAEM